LCNKALLSINERRRHLFIRDGEDSLSAYPEIRAQTQLLALIKDVHQRIWDARG